jgi:hypothetical protein
MVCESLNDFLTTLCLQEAVMSCPNLAAVITDRKPAEIVGGELRSLWMQGKYVFGDPSHDFYATSDEDVLVMDYAGIWVGSPFRSVGDLIVRGSDCQVLNGS